MSHLQKTIPFHDAVILRLLTLILDIYVINRKNITQIDRFLHVTEMWSYEQVSLAISIKCHALCFLSLINAPLAEEDTQNFY